MCFHDGYEPIASLATFYGDDLVRLLRELARFRASSEPELLRNSIRLAYLRRWWLLSTALHVSIACVLDPNVDLAFGTFPPADPMDNWARDTPEVAESGRRPSGAAS